MPSIPPAFVLVREAADAYLRAREEGYPPPSRRAGTSASALSRAKQLLPALGYTALRNRIRCAGVIGLMEPVFVVAPEEAAAILRAYESYDADYRAWRGTAPLPAAAPHDEPPADTLRGATAPPPAAEPPSGAERREILALRAQVQSLRRQIERDDESALLMETGANLLGLISKNPMPPPDWLIDLAAAPDAPGVPVIDFGDWHIGETVLAAEVFGVNEFNEAVADARVARLVERVLHLAFKHVRTPNYPGAVLVLGGDFISGQLHEELLATDWCPPPVATAWCVSRLGRAIAEFRRAFGRLVVVCVPGNHGRLSRKPWAKRGASACFDHVIYRVLADQFAGADDLTFLVPADGEQLIQIASTRFLIMHGHELGVKGGDGIIGALGPIVRGATKVGRQQRSIGRDFDVLMLHHFHQDLWLPASGVIVNPTLKGYDEYSRAQRYRYEPAAQRLFFVHPVWGCNSPWAIYLQQPAARDAVPFVALPPAHDLQVAL